MTQLLPPKKEVALALLERSNVDVYLDPRAKGVVVPPQFRKEPRLILKIGLNMPVPIPDLRVDDESMSCTLSFNRSPFYCVVPWSSCFAMVGEDGRGMVWPDDVPQELAVKVVDPDQAPSREARDGDGKSRADAPASVRSAGKAEGPRSGRGGGRTSKGADRAAASASASGSAAGASGDPGAREEAGSGNTASKKKKGKKKEEGRPVLVAVPSHDRGESDRRESTNPAGSAGPSSRGGGREGARDGVSAIPSPASRRSGGMMPPSSQPSPSLRRPPPSERPREGQVRPKRELPPYLRVVK